MCSSMQHPELFLNLCKKIKSLVVSISHNESCCWQCTQPRLLLLLPCVLKTAEFWYVTWNTLWLTLNKKRKRLNRALQMTRMSYRHGVGLFEDPVGLSMSVGAPSVSQKQKSVEKWDWALITCGSVYISSILVPQQHYSASKYISSNNGIWWYTSPS